MGSTQFFTPHKGFPLITLLLGMLHCLLFEELKSHRFLDTCAKFLVSWILFKSLIQVQNWSLAEPFCLLSSMFIIMRILTRIIKTTCFESTISMAELKGKLPLSKWSLSAHNFPNSGYFHKIFGTHLQKGLVYFYTKKFLPQHLFFFNYNLSPNGQIFSLIDAQPHL